MSETKSFTSAHYPYIPLTVFLNKRIETVEALLDTGFDGDVIIPEGLMTNGKPPDSYLRFTLADQVTNVLPPAYLGRVEVSSRGGHAALWGAQTKIVADVAEVLAILIHSGTYLFPVATEPLVDYCALSFHVEGTPRLSGRPVLVRLGNNGLVKYARTHQAGNVAVL